MKYATYAWAVLKNSIVVFLAIHIYDHVNLRFEVFTMSGIWLIYGALLTAGTRWYDGATKTKQEKIHMYINLTFSLILYALAVYHIAYSLRAWILNYSI